ncbi:hypothetical protein G8O24_39800 [Bradyrhizobium sp. INPA01-394B]|uniref:hypothetical protein n=1 Tax=Bradyrhizobium campsiandrae TaxID=1729892 RepID=UPI00165F7C96|nr:hypothetical protein [Bradyrhizobium campsiandrae]MBC9883435.1 hypothetical protein [Bradyrhizobium campsiandrae]
MAGLDPAIHVLPSAQKDVDARVEPGHDEQIERRLRRGMTVIIYSDLRNNAALFREGRRFC